jgi:hypothetical protein
MSPQFITTRSKWSWRRLGGREKAALTEGIKRRHQTVLTELTAEFDRCLAELQAPNTREQIEAAMASRGRSTPRPKAGTSF